MLLDEIIDRLSDESSSLYDALLKTKVFLHNIGRKDLVDWVNNELNGYSSENVVPEYRRLSSNTYGNISNPRMRYSHHPIPVGHLIPEQLASVENAVMLDPLAGIEDLAKAKELRRNIPMEFNSILSRGLGNGYNVEAAWSEISPHHVKSYWCK